MRCDFVLVSHAIKRSKSITQQSLSFISSHLVVSTITLFVMGNCCQSCCKPSSSSEPRGGGLKFQLLDDDWADEIWYDAVQHHHEHDNHNDDDDDDDNHSRMDRSLLLHDGGEQVYDVTDEELEILRNTLAEKFPQDSHYMSNAYMRSVASKPYSKDMTRRRPLEYSLEKLTHVMEWRQQMHAVDLPERIRLCTLSAQEQAAAGVDEDTLKHAEKMVESLNTGSMYWHGLTKEGRPILWIRTNRKFWYPNVQAEVDALIVMADAGIACMPAGVTDFVCISHSYKPPPPHPPFAYQMLRGLVKGYPDRMHLLVSAPVSSIVEFCMNLLLPIMPGRLAHKFSFYSLEHVQEKLEHMLWHGKQDIPTFFGGPVNHDEFFPNTEKCPNRGEGSLKFDWYGMIERLQQQRDAFEKEQQQQKQPESSLPMIT